MSSRKRGRGRGRRRPREREALRVSGTAKGGRVPARFAEAGQSLSSCLAVRGIISRESLRELEGILSRSVPGDDYEKGWASGVTHLCALGRYEDWNFEDRSMMSVLLAYDDKSRVLRALGLDGKIRLDRSMDAVTPERPYPLREVGGGTEASEGQIPQIRTSVAVPAMSAFVIPSSDSEDSA